MLDFCNCNHREKFRKQEVTGKEQPESSQVKSDFPDGWCIICRPAARQVVAVQRCNDDHKPFKPHTYINDHRHEECYCDVPSHFSEPEDLRRQNVAAHHQPIGPPIWAEWICTVFHKCPHFVWVLSVPGNE